MSIAVQKIKRAIADMPTGGMQTGKRHIKLEYSDAQRAIAEIEGLTAERDALGAQLDDAREQHAATLNRLYEIFSIDASDGEVRAKWALLEAQKAADSNKALAAQVESLVKIVQDNVLIHISANTTNISADAVESVNLDKYDAGYLNNFGGGNVGWWQDYIRSELAAAHDFYQSQLQEYADSIRQGGAE